MQVLSSTSAPVVVVSGPAGAGKTTVGARLAARLGARFLEGDDLHAPAAIAKMRAGVPLDDVDRAPWLARLRHEIEASLARGEALVVACSALRRAWRDVLHVDGWVRFVLLDVAPAELARRLAHRASHFAGPALLASQLATLERPAPGEALVVDGGAAPGAVVEAIAEGLRTAG